MKHSSSAGTELSVWPIITIYVSFFVLGFLLRSTVIAGATIYQTDTPTCSESCGANNCRWSALSTYNNTVVYLIADYTGCCDNAYITAEIYESDNYPSDTDDYVTTLDKINTSDISWSAQWQQDWGFGMRTTPEYYFNLYINRIYQCKSENMMVRR